MNSSQIRLRLQSPRLQWLTDPGNSVEQAVRPQLLAQLLSSPRAIMMGAINGLIVICASIARTDSGVFIVLAALECLIFLARLNSIRKLSHAATRNHVVNGDLPVLLSCAWCALQGTAAFFAMRTGDVVLMVLSATLVMALIGPLCARNYAAPRLALLLVCLCVFPFVLGALTTGNPWYLILVGMTPFFLVGTLQIITNYKSAMVRALTAERHNLEQSRRDPLTKLLNRGGLDARIEQLDATEPLAIVAMDLDGFKEINDRFGHAAGDYVLEQVAKRMQDVLDGEEILARLGGDEFMAVLPDRNPGESSAVADRLLRAICEEAYRIPHGPLVDIGVSIGYACLPEDTKSVSKLREYADNALYAAKGAGKGLTARFHGKTASDQAWSGERMPAAPVIPQAATPLG